MTLHDIKDHDHTLTRVDKRESEYGITVKHRCNDDQCDYWRVEFVPTSQRGLDQFTG